MVNWTAELDKAVLFEMAFNGKPDAARLSKQLKQDITPKALLHRIAKFKKEHADQLAALASAADAAGSDGADKAYGEHGNGDADADAHAPPKQVDDDNDDDVKQVAHIESPKRKRRTKAEKDIVRAEKAAKAIAKAQAKVGKLSKDMNDDDDDDHDDHEIAPLPSPQSPAAAKKRKIKHENGD